MKRWMLLAAVAFAGVAGAENTSPAYMPPMEQSRAKIKWVKPVCRVENRYLAWASVCRTAKGEILVVFSGDRDRHVCPYGKVQLIRSKDDGETWSAPKTIVNGALDDRDAGIVEMPDGRLVVTYFTSIVFKNNPAYRRHYEKIPAKAIKDGLGYFRVESRDGGHTWSEPQRISAAQSPHGPVLLKDGSLLQLGRDFSASQHGQDASGRTIVKAHRSTDAGAGWELLCGEIADANGEHRSGQLFHEPHVAELADGTLVGMVRYHGSDGCMRQTVSRDGGRSWTPMAATPMVGLPPHLLPLADGKLLCVYGRRIAARGFGEFACISDDGGKSWDVANEITLARSHCGDLGYPASCVLAGGDILTVYYQQPRSGTKPCIMATRWRLTK